MLIKKLINVKEYRIIKAKNLENVHSTWTSIGIFPLTPAGEPGMNNAHSVLFIDGEAIAIMTTEGHKILFLQK